MSLSVSGVRRALSGAVLVSAALLAAPPLRAQETPAPPPPAAAAAAAVGKTRILTINMERILIESLAGRDVGAQIDALRKKLRADLDARQAELTAEDQALSAIKSQISREEFQEKAEAYQEKLHRTRQEAAVNSDLLLRARDMAVMDLRRKLAPILQQAMQKHNAALMLDETQMIIAASELDVTAEILKAFDAAVQKIPVPFPPSSGNK